MRVLHVITRLGLGGAERVAELLAIGMVPLGTTSTIFAVAATRDASIARRSRQSLGEHHIEVVVGSRTAAAKAAILPSARALVRTTEQTRPDLVHLHTEIPEFAWALATILRPGLRGIPLVRTVHNSVLWGGWTRIGRLAERRLPPAHVVAVSHAARAAFEAWHGAREQAGPIRVIHNGVDLHRLPDGPAPPRTPPHLLYAGRFEHEKGIDVLAEAIEHIDPDVDPYVVHIHGSGRLGAIASGVQARFPDRVVVGPPIPDIGRRLPEFDAVLMPSRFEGLSILAVEALCAGVPLVATSAPGLAEALPPGYPGVVEPGDPAAFAESMRAFIRDPAVWRHGAREATAWARQRYSLDAMVTAYVEVYRSATPSASSA